MTNESAKRELARTLYTGSNTSNKEILARTGIAESTLLKWIREGNWDTLRHTLLLNKDEQLRLMYEQLSNLNNAIMQGAGYPTAKEVDVQRKLTLSIRQLETELHVGHVIAVAKEFTQWLPDTDFELNKTIINLFDKYIRQKLGRK